MSFLITLIVGRLGVSRLVGGLIAWAAIALITSGAALGVYEVIKHKGADELRAKIEKDNQHGISKGIDARMSFDDCIDAGGVYDFRRQRCSSPTLGPR
ncbi:hypothetical protein [Mesorhizobium sp.]|uniref:hypothetical protein n=1 Tax=Mesorhizobium sp. TaxID=1871066 RepID=UPI000FE68C80|nr:hypothetical protein [Mesorhizobium sp.]RWG02582.1 MAG: hypothetical protein EOQ54_19715 [Mesorhizobium sp.]RWH00787.1 MAG: hypothetical protein EOQ72_09305 [Mesorhizobium sp.]TIN47600.1 MAG: hypothetical protein E5Y25_05270 [Mesorhizobium sp.]TIR92661.1 MAG: hypothetical protein E5X08_13435 [Mesorhizobium sp.]